MSGTSLYLMCANACNTFEKARTLKCLDSIFDSKRDIALLSSTITTLPLDVDRAVNICQDWLGGTYAKSLLNSSSNYIGKLPTKVATKYEL